MRSRLQSIFHGGIERAAESLKWRIRSAPTPINENDILCYVVGWFLSHFNYSPEEREEFLNEMEMVEVNSPGGSYVKWKKNPEPKPAEMLNWGIE